MAIDPRIPPALCRVLAGVEAANRRRAPCEWGATPVGARPPRQTGWQSRIALARRGWTTDLRLEPGMHAGKRDRIGLWAKRWIWQGRVAEVGLFDTRQVDLRDPDLPRQIANLCAHLDAHCHVAETIFVDRVPCQKLGRDGAGRPRLAENSLETARFKAEPPALHPSEAIPDRILFAPVNSETCLDVALARAAAQGLHVEHSLNHYGEGRLVRDCRDRAWQHEIKAAMRTFRGAKVVFAPEWRVDGALDEPAVAGTATRLADDLVETFALFAPGGARHGDTANGLPPGHETVAEMAARQDAERALHDMDLSL